MLTEKIKTHNYINGFVFSAVEFILVAVIILPFFIYYVVHERILLSIISCGLILNSLTISAFAILSIRKKEKSIGFRFYRDTGLRNEIGKSQPNLFNDTMILCFSLLIPFYLFFVIIYERKNLK